MKTRSYTELSRLVSYEDRYEYLRLNGQVGMQSYDVNRWISQDFYKNNPEWRRIRKEVVLRDNGCDLGIPGREIHGSYTIHHINPITREDISHGSDLLFDLDNLITTTHDTHNAIHYGDKSLLLLDPIEREPYDTCPWKKGCTNDMDRIIRDNVFYRNRHTIQALSRVREIDLKAASDFWSERTYLAHSHDKREWFRTIDRYIEENRLDELFD